MKHLDAVMIDIDEVEIVEHLQHEVRRVIEHVATGMIIDPLQKHLEGDAVMQILTRMDLIAKIDAGLVEGVEDRPPALRQFIECCFHQTRRPLRPGVEIGPGQGAGKADMLGQAEIGRRFRRQIHLIHRPGLTLGWIATHLWCRKTIKRLIVSWMHGDQLALQVGRQLGDLDTVLARDSFDLVTIGLRPSRLLEIEQPPIPAWHLHALEAETSRPFGDAVE